MTIYPEDNRYIQQVMQNQEYGFINHYPVVVDCGANIGTFSFWIYNNATTIYALEPVETNVQLLQENIKNNNLTKIVVKQLAISDSSLVKTMERRGDPAEGGWVVSEAGDYVVQCLSMDDFLITEGIPYVDLLKLDTEGHEAAIVGARYFPYHKIGTIIGELHGNKGTPIYDDVQAILTWYGYQYYELPNNHFLARKR